MIEKFTVVDDFRCAETRNNFISGFFLTLFLFTFFHNFLHTYLDILLTVIFFYTDIPK